VEAKGGKDIEVDIPQY